MPTTTTKEPLVQRVINGALGWYWISSCILVNLILPVRHMRPLLRAPYWLKLYAVVGAASVPLLLVAVGLGLFLYQPLERIQRPRDRILVALAVVIGLCLAVWLGPWYCST